MAHKEEKDERKVIIDDSLLIKEKEDFSPDKREEEVDETDIIGESPLSSSKKEKLIGEEELKQEFYRSGEAIGNPPFIKKFLTHHILPCTLTLVAGTLIGLSLPSQNCEDLEEKIPFPEKNKPNSATISLPHQVSELERQLDSREACYLIQDQNFTAQKKAIDYWQARAREAEGKLPWLVLSHQQKVKDCRTAKDEAGKKCAEELKVLEDGTKASQKKNQEREKECQREISKLGEENAKLESRYAPLEDQLKNLINDYQKLKTEFKKKENGLVGKEEKKNYQIKIAGMEGKIKELNDKYQQERTHSASLTQTITHLKKELDNYSRERVLQAMGHQDLLFVQKETLRLSRKARQERRWLDFGTPEKLCYHLINQTCNSNMLAFTRTNYTKIKEYVIQHSRR